MDDSSFLDSGFFQGLLNAANPIVEAYSNKLAYGEQAASEIALARERANLARLNGSGPNNGAAAIGAAGSLREWLFGSPATQTAPATSGNWLMVVGVGAAVFGIIWLLRRY